MKIRNLLTFLVAAMTFSAPFFVSAAVISSVPGPDDQGGMIMPMVTITGADNYENPSSGAITITFNPTSVPVLSPLETWSSGNWFAEDAAWRVDLGSPSGVGGTPETNAGNGDLFNNQYGFMFMAMPMMGTAYVPVGKSLAIRLTAVSSSLMEIYNYGNAENRWDQVFPSVGSQLLWNGTMWHNYFTLPALAEPGAYTATFEVFIANQEFTSGTGYVDYSESALTATRDENFTSAVVEYTWSVIPEPSSWMLALLALLLGCAGWLSQRLGSFGQR